MRRPVRFARLTAAVAVGVAAVAGGWLLATSAHAAATGDPPAGTPPTGAPPAGDRSASTPPAGIPPTGAPPAGEAWWTPVGLPGQRVDLVEAGGSGLLVRAGGRLLASIDRGHTFTAANAPLPTASPSVPDGRGGSWAVVAGRVVHDGQPDPRSPDLGQSAARLAAPVALQGVVVAVASDGTVWRRSQEGDWSRALILLPGSLIHPTPPAVTAVAAFSTPLSATVYLGTDGFSVLESLKGGSDWIRAGPGLPDHVLDLATDPASRAIYAGTDDGLWVHHLRALPRPPQYVAADLRPRQLATALLSLAALVAAAMALRRLAA